MSRQDKSLVTRPSALILTCEHAAHRVPTAYAHLFRGAGGILTSHRGWDPGSLALGRAWQRRAGGSLLVYRWTRLLVEPNRSLRHPRLFSEFTRKLPLDQRREVVTRYYRPHRERVEREIAQRIAAGHCVVHVGMHTFTPQLDGVTRRADVGLLYDPGRRWEQHLCVAWQQALRRDRPDLAVRRNYPYLGKADGLTTHLRHRFPDACYAGIELEVNQKWVATSAWPKLCQHLAEILSGSGFARE